MNYASKKAASVRNLKRTTAKIVQADGADFPPRQPPKILAGILALDGALAQSAQTKLKEVSEKYCLNLGCSLSGSFFSLKDFHPWQENRTPYNLIAVNKSPNALVLFFLNLIFELRKLGTVPAMDLEKYISRIK